ncbi:MAG: DedA family protein [Vulcanimicrobiaceae bacterium]
MAHFQDAVIALVDHYGYAGIFIAMALGNVGAPVGAEVVMTVAGALVATGHLASLWLAIAVGVAGELAGATAGYAAGKFGGRSLIDRYGKYVHLTHANLDRVHAFFEKYGSFSIFICRFIPVIRGIVSIPAGIADMALGPFYFWYAFGSLLFCGGLVFLGNAVGHDFNKITPLVHKGGLVLLAVTVLAAAVIAIVVMRRNKANAG